MLPFLNLWLHVLASVIWIGGMLFLSLVAVPVLRQVDSPLLRADLFRKMAQRFRRLVWICIVVLILTGIVNVAYYGNTSTGSPYLKVLGIKLGLVGVLVALGVADDFIIGPRAARAHSRDGLPPNGTELLMVQLTPTVGRLHLLLGVIMLGLAAALTRSH